MLSVEHIRQDSAEIIMISYVTIEYGIFDIT